eukprot:contig_37705_g8858
MYHLVAGTKSGDSLFFHFSGYGSQVRDVNGDEPDFMDEALVPTDSMHAGNVLDDDVHKLLVAKLRQGVHLTALFDTCHSASAMDLPFSVLNELTWAGGCRACLAATTSGGNGGVNGGHGVGYGVGYGGGYGGGYG